MKFRFIILLAMVCLAMWGGEAVAQIPSIPDIQDPTVAPEFVGTPVFPHPLRRKTPTEPLMAPVGGMHSDAGNTDVDGNHPGPLGWDPLVKTAVGPCAAFMFDDLGRMSGACVNPETHKGSITALDPDTMSVLGRFEAPGDDNVLMAYALMDDQGRIMTPTQNHHFMVVERIDTDTETYFKLVRDVDLGGVLEADERLLATVPDGEGNVWFATGGVQNSPQAPIVDYTTIGYFDEYGNCKVLYIDDEIVENGFAVATEGAYIVTSKAFYALSIDDNGEIVTRWRKEYDYGSGIKPGGFAEGSGSTVTLLGNKYVTITDNADDRVSLLVYHRKGRRDGNLVCQVPLFSDGASAVDVSPIGHKLHGGRYGVVVANIYNAPSFYIGDGDLNGDWNDLSVMAPGMTRIDVLPGGCGCETVWQSPIRSTTVSKLSTATGLIYTYTQDNDLAQEGTYVWYMSAIDFRTGEEVFKVRVGAGGLKNNNFLTPALGPDGTMYQGVLGGIVAVKDQGEPPPCGHHGHHGHHGNCDGHH